MEGFFQFIVLMVVSGGIIYCFFQVTWIGDNGSCIACKHYKTYSYDFTSGMGGGTECRAKIVYHKNYQTGNMVEKVESSVADNENGDCANYEKKTSFFSRIFRHSIHGGW